MLNKYEEFFKLSHTQECSIYQAVSRIGSLQVLLKRFKNSKLTWDQILKSKHLQYSQKTKIFPKMIQIFKNKTDYYIVYQKPTGLSFDHLETIGKLTLQNFYIMFDDLCQAIRQLKQIIPNVYILPQWIFMHRNSIKIVHFEPFFHQPDYISSNHVYLYKIQNKQYLNMAQSSQQSAVIPLDKKRNIILQMGLIAYFLLTGQKTIVAQDQDQYLTKLTQISQNAQKKITKVTKDKSLGYLIGKMLSSNVFDMPDINKISDIIQSKANLIRPNKRNHTNNIQISLQTIKLQPSPQKQQPQPRKKLRPCCAEKEASIQKINEQNRIHRQQKSAQKQSLYLSQVYVNNSSFKKTPFFPTIKKVKNTHQRHKTMMDLMNTTNSKPMMFGMRSSIFKT